MLQGMFGKRLAEHFSLLESSSLVLGPKGNSQVALTRMRMPNGFPGPTPHIPPEKAFSISVHLRRPDSIKGWGTWLDGRFHRVTEWDAGGIQIFDMESEPVALRTSGFDSVHVYIPRSVINRFSDENEQKRIRNLHCTPGTKDDVILHWARMMLPFSDRPLQLPRLVIDEMIMMFCAHLGRTYQGRSQPPEVVTGGSPQLSDCPLPRGRPNERRSAPEHRSTPYERALQMQALVDGGLIFAFDFASRLDSASLAADPSFFSSALMFASELAGP